MTLQGLLPTPARRLQEQLTERVNVSKAKRIRCWPRHVRCDALSFPVLTGESSTHLTVWNSHLEPGADGVGAPRVCGTRGPFANDHGATTLLENEGEPLSSRKGAFGREYIGRACSGALRDR